MTLQPQSNQSIRAQDLDAICSRYSWLSQGHFVESTASTQILALDVAAAHPGGVLVLADEQTSGYGRGGRGWFSPKGAGLWLSLVLSPARPQEEWPLLTSLAALALHDAMATLANLETGIKWPNDLYCGGRKLAGVLADSVAMARVDDRRRVVLGLGINLLQQREEFPPDLQECATSLRLEWGGRIQRRDVLIAILDQLTSRFDQFESDGPRGLREDLLKASLLLGRRVGIDTSVTPAADWTGRVVDLGPLGELVLELEADSSRRTLAGGTVRWADPPIVGGS